MACFLNYTFHPSESDEQVQSALSCTLLFSVNIDATNCHLLLSSPTYQRHSTSVNTLSFHSLKSSISISMLKYIVCFIAYDGDMKPWGCYDVDDVAVFLGEAERKCPLHSFCSSHTMYSIWIFCGFLSFPGKKTMRNNNSEIQGIINTTWQIMSRRIVSSLSSSHHFPIII